MPREERWTSLSRETLAQEAAVLLSAHRIEDLRDADEVHQLVSGALVEFPPAVRRALRAPGTE